MSVGHAVLLVLLLAYGDGALAFIIAKLIHISTRRAE